MTDEFDDRLRKAMHDAAGAMAPATPAENTRARLVSELARRRHRRRGLTLGGFAAVALVVSTGALTLPSMLNGHGGQRVVASGRPADGGSTANAVLGGHPGESSHSTFSGGTSVAGNSVAASIGQASPQSSAAQGTRLPATSSAGTSIAGTSTGGAPNTPVYAQGSPQGPGQGSSGLLPPSTTPTTGLSGTVSSASGFASSSPGVVVPGSISTPSPTTAPSTVTSTTVPGSSGQPIVLTRFDGGQVVTLAVGQTLAVDLTGSSFMPWTEPDTSDPAVLSRQSGSADAMTGDAYGTFLAVSPGKAVISSVGNPACRNVTPPCELPSQAWMVTVNVTGQG